MRTCACIAAVSVALLFPASCPADTGQPNGQPPRYSLGALYVADALSNVQGGLREGSAWLDFLELAVEMDAGRILGLGQLTTYASLVHSNRPTFSDRYVGDAMVVSNIDSGRALRVLEAWFDWGFAARGPGSLRVGLYDLNSEFDTTESRGLFINSAYGMGQELAQTGRNGPSVYPVTALAARVGWAPHERWRVELAVVDGVPGDPGDTHRSRWHLSSSEGALCIAELTTSAGPLAQLSVGHWRYTGTFEGLRPDRADSERDNHGTYVTAEFASHDPPRSDRARLHGFLRAGEANDRVNVFERHLAAGVVIDWPWPGPHGSQLGLAASEARVGADHRGTQRRAAAPVARYERNVELTWRVPLGAHAVLQPDLQYVVNPGAERRVPDAWVLGLRMELSLLR